VENFDYWIFRLQQFWMINFLGKKHGFGGKKSFEQKKSFFTPLKNCIGI